MSPVQAPVHYSQPVVVSEDTYFFDARVYPPPKGVKMLLLTRHRVAIIGQWQEGMIGWFPLPNVPESLK